MKSATFVYLACTVYLHQGIAGTSMQ